MKNALVIAMLAALVVAGAACSARTQLAMEETKKNGAHFATWNHMGYSVNRGTPETTTEGGDIEVAKADRCLPSQTCAWWGAASPRCSRSSNGVIGIYSSLVIRFESIIFTNPS